MKPSLRYVVLLGLVLVTGCTDQDGTTDDGDASPRRRAEPAFPERTAEPVIVSSGRNGSVAWELVAQDSAEGACLELRIDGGEGTEGCGFEVPERHDVAFFVTDGDANGTFVAGAVAPGVAAVRLEHEGGAPVEAQPVGEDAGLASDFFVATLPAGSRLDAVVALGEGDDVLERRSATGEDAGAGHDGAGQDGAGQAE